MWAPAFVSMAGSSFPDLNVTLICRTTVQAIKLGFIFKRLFCVVGACLWFCCASISESVYKRLAV